jgi:hypothetical protein
MTLQVKPKYIDDAMTTDQELSDGLLSKEDKALKNQPNGYAGLDSSGKVPMALLPSDIGSSVGSVDGGSPTSQYLTENLDGGDANGN